MQIRADLADCGLYVFSHQCYKLMCHMMQEKDYEWCSLADDVIPFLARNQFKEQI
jgi:hypothetical protein